MSDDAELSRNAEILASLPDITRITAAGLLAEMPELGEIDGKAAASLAGLASFTRESGRWKGRSRIGGGRPRVRRLLYMASLTAINRNPDLARKYQSLRDHDKPGKVALAAIMRKMLVLLNVSINEDRLWQPVQTEAQG